MVDNKKSKQLRKALEDLKDLVPGYCDNVELAHRIAGLSCRMCALEAVLEKNRVIATGAVLVEYNLFMGVAVEMAEGQIKTIKGAIGKK